LVIIDLIWASIFAALQTLVFNPAGYVLHLSHTNSHAHKELALVPSFFAALVAGAIYLGFMLLLSWLGRLAYLRLTRDGNCKFKLLLDSIGLTVAAMIFSWSFGAMSAHAIVYNQAGALPHASIGTALTVSALVCFLGIVVGLLQGVCVATVLSLVVLLVAQALLIDRKIEPPAVETNRTDT
jgi:hypothetical protein